MDFLYNVTIKSSKDEIKFISDSDNGNEAIKFVKFEYVSFDTTMGHDKNSRVEITIGGDFDNRLDTLNSIKQLADWVKHKTDNYCTITVEMITRDMSNDAGNFKRTYIFDQMFCINYSETASDGKTLHFELKAAQSPSHKTSETKSEIVN